MGVRLVSVLWFALMVSVPALSAHAQSDPEVERALAAARARAAAGDRVAQFSLGALLYYGGRDLTAAVDWLRRAAGQGHPDAEFHVGQLHDFGFGVEQNDRQALDWYRRAAGHGSAAAQRAVGDFYRKGRGVGPDAAQAASWYRRGADGDDLRAQYELGHLYFEGAGVARDYASAYFWFSLAAGQTPLPDNRQALIELRNIAAARMTTDDVAAAEARVAAWKPRAVPAR